MANPDLMSFGPLPSRAESALSEHFTVHKAYPPDDPDGVIARIGPTCRFAVAAGSAGPLTDARLARLPSLQIVANFGVGCDSIDVAACARRGIIVTNTPGVLDDEVADTTIGLLLSTIRRLPMLDGFVRSGGWSSAKAPWTATLVGKRVGIVGMGRIGQAVARRLSGFALAEVAYHTRRPVQGLGLRHQPDLVSLAREVDALIVIVPGGTATNGLVTREVLEALGPTGCFINVARGSVVDELALLELLQTGQLGMAGLDVFINEPNPDPRFFELDNVVLLPHVGSATHETRERMGALVVDNLLAWKDGRSLLTPLLETPQRGSALSLV
jgi:lactate dehydrogenase-like 2-hydroxyacid dehydrogenase